MTADSEPSAPAEDEARLFSKANKLHQRGQLAEATALYNDILRANPNHAQALMSLGAACLQRGDYDESMRFTQRSLEIDPNQYNALNNLGVCLINANRPAEALPYLEQAIRLNPDKELAHMNRGNALRALKMHRDALESFGRAIQIGPANYEALLNYGIVLSDLDRHNEALVKYEQAIALAPHKAMAHFFKGNALTELRRHDEALRSYDTAIALKPIYIEAYGSKANALKDLKRHAEAFACCEKALTLAPNHADVNWNKALLKLLTGDYEDGWRLYEWRFAQEENKKYRQKFSDAPWLGLEDVKDKTVHIYAEQGFGDIIQYSRFIPMVAARGAKVILEAPVPLMNLLLTLKGPIEVIAHGAAHSPYDYHCPTMSLPRVFNTTLATIPASCPYLSAEVGKVQRWATRLGPKSKPRVGLVWAGQPENTNDKNRSIGIAKLLPLISDQFEFHALHKEFRAEDDIVLTKNHGIKTHAETLRDFSDTAALIAHMDVVVTVDTAVAHLTGAIGKPVFIMLPYAPDYRWLEERTDSPWYPSARLFRQPRFDDWASVVSEVKQALNNVSR